MAFSYKTKPPIYALVIVFSFFRTNAQIGTPCTSSMISTFTPCLNFVTGSSGSGSSPTQDCCDSLEALMGEGLDCGCLILTGSVPFSMPFFNRNLGMALPRLCQSSIPVKCKASGDSLPAPGPPLPGPTVAPTASSTAENSPEAVAAPVGAGSSEVEPESPSPSENPRIRQAVDPNSDSNRITIPLSLCFVLVSVAMSL